MRHKTFLSLAVALLPAFLLTPLHPADARWARDASRWGRSTASRPFTPLSVPGCGMWLDAARGVSYNSGFLVGSWNDRSPRNNDATGVSDATKPLWLEAGLSGRPAVRFDGNDDYLTAHSAAALLTGNDTPFTLVTVLALDTSAPEAGFAGATDNEAGYILQKACRRQNGKIRYKAKDNSDTKEVVGATDYLTIAQVVSFVNTGAVCSLYQNSAPIGSGDANIAAVTLNYFWIGKTYGTSSSYFEGVIAQLLVYDRTLSDAQRERVERYLKRRYGIL